jgi:hypothetical protein
MKKYISMMAMALMLSMSFTACDVETDEKPGGTNIEKMCGYWDVVYDGVDENGNVVYEDPYGAGVCTVYTFNTASNGTAQMWLDDQKTFWAYKFLVNINYDSRTFFSDEVWYDAKESGKAIVTNGKILEGAAKNEHGLPTDSIVFEILFDDDSYAGTYWTKLRASGRKHSGFTE